MRVQDAGTCMSAETFSVWLTLSSAPLAKGEIEGPEMHVIW